MPSRNSINLSTPYGRKKFRDSPEWKAIRRIKLLENPFCEICKQNNILKEAIDVHHIIDIKDDTEKALQYDNLQCLCKSCHSKITYGAHLAGEWQRQRTFEVVNKKWKI